MPLESTFLSSSWGLFSLSTIMHWTMPRYWLLQREDCTGELGLSTPSLTTNLQARFSTKWWITKTIPKNSRGSQSPNTKVSSTTKQHTKMRRKATEVKEPVTGMQQTNQRREIASPKCRGGLQKLSSSNTITSSQRPKWSSTTLRDNHNNESRK